MCTLQIDPEAEAACIKKKEHLSFIAGNKKRVFIIPPDPPLSPGPGACKERKPLISRIFCTKKKPFYYTFLNPSSMSSLEAREKEALRKGDSASIGWQARPGSKRTLASRALKCVYFWALALVLMRVHMR